MELGRFKARIESDRWEAANANGGKNDLLFEDVQLESDRIRGLLKMDESEKGFQIVKKGESFIIKTDFFIGGPSEMEIKFVKNNLQLSDKKTNAAITIFNKEAYD